MVKETQKNQESLGGELGDYPNEKYRKFFEQFGQIETLDVTEWKPVHVLAYFVKRFETHFGKKYEYKFNNPSPLKCFEVFQIKKLGVLLSSSPKVCRDYIDWIFDQSRAIQAKRRTISFITEENTVMYYKNNILLAGKKNLNVDRSTQLPLDYRTVFQDIGVNVQSYGDLAFLFQMEKTPQMEAAFLKLKELGFDEDIVGRIV